MAEKGDLDLTGAKLNRGLWLVKVPKYLSQQWGKATERGEVGKLKISKGQGKTEVSFVLSEELAGGGGVQGTSAKSTAINTPRDHVLALQGVAGQSLGVFTEGSSGKQTDATSGNVVYGCRLKSPPSRCGCLSSSKKRSRQITSPWQTTSTTSRSTAGRKRRASAHVPTSSRFWTCSSLPSRSTSTTTSETWWTSPSSLLHTSRIFCARSGSTT
ncbi:general transcription factor IIF subunit 2 isoform X2 [Petromyzon marinus]|uniref:general transcription factor IIF subunit 2 isoform X2 n=1 Tax=Petromyzon marinus TaxID=7757 RepID=UPI003F7079E9